MLLGSWLIIGVSDQGKINQGESWGMFGAALFTHRPRWMKLHLSVFSCITLKLVVYSFFPPSLPLLSPPHSCVSGLLEGLGGEIPVIFVFSLFSGLRCPHMHLAGISLTCCLNAISMLEARKCSADVLHVEH